MAAVKEDKKTVLQRLNAVQDEVDYVQKEKKAGMRYSIVSHDAVTAKVRPLMVKHGVLYFPHEFDMKQVGNRTELTCLVRFANIDDRDDWIDVGSAGYGIDEQDKGPGKAISYAVKYALLKCLGLESGDDPDYDQDVKHEDPGNPHNLAMVAFEADVEKARSEDDLKKVASTHKLNIELALANLPARAQIARQKYAARLRELKQATDSQETPHG
jgi:hypothetical protein